MKKTGILLSGILLAAMMLTSCMKGGTAASTTQHVLRVASLYGGDESGFRQQNTELFEAEYPNIDVEIVPVYDQQLGVANENSDAPPVNIMDKLAELMQGSNPPDIIVLDSTAQLSMLIQKNLLAPLDPQIQANKFDTSDIVPAVIDGLKSLSPDGKLYALSPLFTSSALIYNKQMFTDAGVDFPTNNMTWDQVFSLAQRVSSGEGKDRKYGFSFNSQSMGEDLFNSMQQSYTQPLQLTMYDDSVQHMTVDTPQWNQVWTTMLQISKENFLPPAPKDNGFGMYGDGGMSVPAAGADSSNSSGDSTSLPFPYNDFLSGRVAMTIIGYGELSTIINANKNADSIKNYTQIDWDVVTEPDHPEAPGIRGDLYYNNLMGINAKSTNLADAWKFIAFTNGPKWAKLKSHSTYQLVSRKTFIKPQDGLNFNMNAFLDVNPSPPMPDQSMIYQTYANIYSIQQLGQNEFDDVIAGKKSVADALKDWQAKGNKFLALLQQNPKASMDPADLDQNNAGFGPKG